MRRFGFVLAILVITIWLGAWTILSGAGANAKEWARGKVVAMAGDAGFKVANILVEGREYSDSDVILALLNMRKGDPIFAFSPYDAQEQLEKISWVDTAHVERRLPDTIYIRINERVPLALWEDDKTIRLLDDKGEVIAADNIGRFKGLMVVAGENAPEYLANLAHSLTERPELARRVKLAELIGNRRWDLVMESGMAIRLPEIGIDKALERLETAHVSGGLLDKDIESVDMRELDRIAVRVKSGQVQTYKDSIEDVSAGGNSI
ncbi:MAG: FtsQ-type POTRA domain-containing protein [Micavibrio sp.]|nr:FtsQ-type POTRA domain-containing protein [Micavibrio sp.]